MEKYKFHIKGSKEAIFIIEALSEIEATKIFTKIKNLKLESFLLIYDVSILE